MSDGTKARDAYASKKDFEKSSIQHSFSPSPSELGTARSQLVYSSLELSSNEKAFFPLVNILSRYFQFF